MFAFIAIYSIGQQCFIYMGIFFIYDFLLWISDLVVEVFCLFDGICRIRIRYSHQDWSIEIKLIYIQNLPSRTHYNMRIIH